jgi:hypothetical protein
LRRSFWSQALNEAEPLVDLFNGSMFRALRLRQPHALRSPVFDGVVLDEFADEGGGVISPNVDLDQCALTKFGYDRVKQHCR